MIQIMHLKKFLEKKEICSSGLARKLLIKLCDTLRTLISGEAGYKFLRAINLG